MSRAHYTNIRNSMHTYSRAPIAEGQEFIDQAVARSGHHVNLNEVRADILPIITSITERDEYFLIENEMSGVRVVGGKCGSKFTKIIKFLDKVSLQEIPLTNGESFRIVDSKGNPFKNFIDPSDVPVNDVKLSDGYEFRLIAGDGVTIIDRNYGWDFDPFNGILHFSSNFKPSSNEWIQLGFGTPLFEGFVYIGKYANESASNIEDKISEAENVIQSVIDNSIAIQPFKFSTAHMSLIGEPYMNQIGHYNDKEIEYIQKFSFVVPGYCFELTSLDQDLTVLTEMRHLPTGDTQIFLDLPWNKSYSKPIINYEYKSGIDGLGPRSPVLGDYHFIATTFIKSNGKKIKVNDLIDYQTDNIDIITPNESYDYIMNYDQGWATPPNGVAGNNYYQGNDYDVNINVNN